MPLRSVMMKRFIFGFQRRVWCPKWTPLSRSWRMVTTAMVILFLVCRPGAVVESPLPLREALRHCRDEVCFQLLPPTVPVALAPAHRSDPPRGGTEERGPRAIGSQGGTDAVIRRAKSTHGWVAC